MMPPDLDRLDRQQREKGSKRNRGLPSWSTGAASACRRLTGAELEARARELGAAVCSSPKSKSQRRVPREENGTPDGALEPRRSWGRRDAARSWSSNARWEHLRLKGQARFFDIDRLDRVAACAPGTRHIIEAAEGDKQ